MRFTILRGPVGIALVLTAILLMASFAVPALGGPSLKGLVKKEVAKQLAGKTGPAGPVGPAGAAGANGAQGPGATRLHFDQPDTDGQLRTVATVNELTVLASCTDILGTTDLVVSARSSVGGATMAVGTLSSDGIGALTGQIPLDVPVPTSGQQTIVDLQAGGGAANHGFTQATFETGSRTISLQLYSLADGNAGGSCEVRGTAVPAS